MRLINADREWNAEGRPALRVIARTTADRSGRAIIASTFPLLDRITGPEVARNE
jgi:hypothetical protein